MKKNKINFFSIEINSAVILSMFVFSYAGILPLYFGWDQYRYQTGTQDKILIFKLMIFSIWSIFSFVVGLIASKNFLGLSSYVPTFSPTRSLKKVEISITTFLLVFCIIVTAVYLINIQQVAIWVAINKGAKAAAVARSEMGNNFSGKYHWYNLIIHDLLNVITFALFANCLIKKQFSNIAIFLFSLFSSIFTSLMALEKSRAAFLIIGLFFTYSLVKKNGLISKTSAFTLFVFLLIILVLYYIFFMGVRDPLVAISCVFSRLFSGQVQPAYFYLNFFPEHHDFLWGRSFPNPGGIFPFEPYRLTVEIMNWKFPNLSNDGIVGSMPTVFWGELYANFGNLGILIAPFFVGAAFYFVSWSINKLENTPLKTGFYVWLIFHYMELSLSGISKFIADFYLIGILFFLLPMFFYSNRKIGISGRVKALKGGIYQKFS